MTAKTATAVTKSIMGRIQSIFPAPPESVRIAAEEMQIDRLRRQVPNLYTVAIFNTVIILLSLWHDGASLLEMTIPAALILFCAIRILLWVRRDLTAISPAQATKILHRVTIAAVCGTIAASAWCIWSLLAQMLAYPTLGPISLALGMICVAHCLATVRVPAILALAIGIYPSSIVMVLMGDTLSVILGLTFMTSALLQVRLVNEQYGLMIKGLLMEQTIRDQANTDSLTGLFNRRAFMAALEADIAGGKRFGIALIDLDGFKAVNDVRGHLAGDLVLQDVGVRLSAICDPRDTVARLGGDEFVVLFRDATTDRAIAVKATEILDALSVGAGATVGPPDVTASLGYAAFPQDGTTATALLAAADDALYAAKAAGKAQAMGYGTRPSQRLVA